MSKVVVTKDKLDALANVISAKSGEDIPMTIDEMVETVENLSIGDDILVVTFSYNETSEMWEPDKTLTEIATSYQDEKEIVFRCDTENPVTCWWEDDSLECLVYVIITVEGDDLNENLFVYTSEGVSSEGVHSTYDVSNATALPSEVASGSTFFTYTGYETGTATRRTSSDLSQEGGSGDYDIIVPAGYYASQATKSVSIPSGSATPASTISATGASVSTGTNTLTLSKSVSNTPNVSEGYISSGTSGNSSVSLTASVNTRSSSDLTESSGTVTAPAGYYASAASKTVTSGSATTPATAITANPSISISSSGLITATASATQSVTPTVSAGYVSSGTAGTITVSGSNTEQLSTQGATTYNTSSSDQTISSGKYLTGTQTIKAVTTSGISAANIKYGTTVKVGDSNDDDRIAGVVGTFSGSSTVSSGQTAATAAQILSGYSAFVNGAEVQGTANVGADVPVFTLTYNSVTDTVISITCDTSYSTCATKLLTGQNDNYTIAAVLLWKDSANGTIIDTNYYPLIVSQDTEQSGNKTIIRYHHINANVTDILYASDGTITTDSSTFYETLNITTNGTYYPDEWAIGQVVVNVAGGGGSGITQDANGYIILPSTGSGGGGGRVEAEQKKVNFIDYDGKILYSYTSAEFAELSALPDNPTYTDRTGLGWNWTLAQIQTQLSACPHSVIWVGQKTKASDGKTHIKVVIPDGTPSNRLVTSIRYTQSTAYGVSIDWDDGSTPETHSTSGSNISHTYAQPGIYDIKISATDGTVSFIGSSSSGIFGDNTLRYYMDRAKSVTFGDNVSGIDGYTYYNWGGGDNVYIPAIVTGTNGAECSYAYGIRYVIVGDTVTAVTQNMFRYAYGLERISLPYGITSIGYRAFNYCNNLTDITIPNSVTSIGELAFSYCTGLTSLSIPSGVTSIGAQAFANNPGIGAYHFYSSAPPTLSNSNAFSGISSDTKIYVPSASLNTYKGASNWSTYSSYMEGE